MFFFQQLPARSFQTSAVARDIDSAAKFIGAGAATVGVAGSGKFGHFADVIVVTPTPYDDPVFEDWHTVVSSHLGANADNVQLPLGRSEGRPINALEGHPFKRGRGTRKPLVGGQFLGFWGRLATGGEVAFAAR